MIFQVNFFRIAPGNFPSRLPVEESTPEKVAADESPRGANWCRPRLSAASLFEGVGRPQIGVVLHPGGAFLWRDKGEVMEMSGEAGYLSVNFKSFMHAASGEAGAAFTEEADETVGVPVAVPDPTVAIPDDAGKFVTAEGLLHWLAAESFNGGDEFRGEFLVAIDAQYPVIRGEREGEVLLADVPGPLVKGNARAVALAEFLRAVGAATIDDDDFIDHRAYAGEATIKVVLFVSGNETGRDIQDTRLVDEFQQNEEWKISRRIVWIDSGKFPLPPNRNRGR